MNSEFHELILEICRKNNIRCSILSDGWIIVLERGSKSKSLGNVKESKQQLKMI